MNLFRSNHQDTTLELNHQLSDFGLHPADWELIYNSNNQIKIQHKQESSFYFLGLTQKVNGKNIWKNIILAGL
ncbi:MAG: hypothetical protein A2622_11825 [Bdellovibrionales bacterium RIFCSPHIGHO2_01_FULL_40_29]|nr:MAG: hypothetical protein A2622_11825 [Bdellovibrionales bacterium RIFCSPHIGHO2_01_FULL_40_29]OFZ35295.1 MAG: hypothetical protein A3D17_08820 [Bdellovibrionales bacterium RIFCSPHIGHO2_02_FULL_40_15]